MSVFDTNHVMVEACGNAGVTELSKYMQQYGFGVICPLLRDSKRGDGIVEDNVQRMNSGWAAPFLDKGIAVAPWVVCREDAEQDARSISETIQRFNCRALLANVEDEYKISTGNGDNTNIFTQEISRRVPYVDKMVSTFAPMWQIDIRYHIFDQQGYYSAPQTYSNVTNLWRADIIVPNIWQCPQFYVGDWWYRFSIQGRSGFGKCIGQLGSNTYQLKEGRNTWCFDARNRTVYQCRTKKIAGRVYGRVRRAWIKPTFGVYPVNDVMPEPNDLRSQFMTSGSTSCGIYKGENAIQYGEKYFQALALR
jgi:hypothetical protein